MHRHEFVIIHTERGRYASHQPYTRKHMMCPCGKTRTRVVQGHWTLEELRDPRQTVESVLGS